jgi:hypothetical protein
VSNATPLFNYKQGSLTRLIQELRQPIQDDGKVYPHIQGGHTSAQAIIESHAEATHVDGHDCILSFWEYTRSGITTAATANIL